MKDIVKQLLPPILLNRLRVLFANKFTGNYKNWHDALEHSKGYDNNDIFEKVKDSALKVHREEAAFERDSVIFDKIEYSWPLLVALMWTAANENGRLDVLDFGGSLGSTYYQNRKFLETLNNYSWNIVEQEHFVKFGKENIGSDKIKFYSGISECLANKNINVVLFSSVIGYLKEPFVILNEIINAKTKYIIFDRTLFNNRKQEDIITVQKVPASIYKASYPCWLFSEEKFKNYFIEKRYRLIEEFNASDGETKKYISKGFIFQNLEA